MTGAFSSGVISINRDNGVFARSARVWGGASSRYPHALLSFDLSIFIARLIAAISHRLIIMLIS